MDKIQEPAGRYTGTITQINGNDHAKARKRSRRGKETITQRHREREGKERGREKREGGKREVCHPNEGMSMM